MKILEKKNNNNQYNNAFVKKTIKMYERENLLNSIVISVWSGKFNEKEYAYRWRISRRNKSSNLQ